MPKIKKILEKPQIVTIESAVKETPTVVTLRFKCNGKTKPGQFYMVWIPGIDEIPMSVSYVGKLKGITVRAVGEATKALTSLKAGDKIGIRGPYGNGYLLYEHTRAECGNCSLGNVGGELKSHSARTKSAEYHTKNKKLLFVCGGAGTASVAPLVEQMKSKKRATVVIGAKTKDELFFMERLEKAARVIACTDDGTCGIKGFATCAVEELLDKEKFDEIITCGPEAMMVAIFKMAEKQKIPIQASMERYMKCGIGICGQCCMDGYTVCKDGPVFTSTQLRKIKDFGKFKRDASGKRVKT